MPANALKMLTADQIDRQTVLKGISLGAWAVVLQPFLNALAAEARGEAPPPRKYQEGAKETANRTVRNFYLALLHAVGDKRESFGELDLQMPAAAQAGPLTELLA
jgi:hypothetical protein